MSNQITSTDNGLKEFLRDFSVWGPAEYTQNQIDKYIDEAKERCLMTRDVFYEILTPKGRKFIES